MKLIHEPLPGVKILSPFAHYDKRGAFVKIFHNTQFSNLGINIDVKEEFYTTSALGALRGMHYQAPPHAHQKIVTCISGGVLDVVLDIRSGSPTYGRYASFELTENNQHIVYIPLGFAHGFISLKANSCLLYMTDSVHNANSDSGILWSSFGFTWPSMDNEIIISERDLQHIIFSDFKSPF